MGGVVLDAGQGRGGRGATGGGQWAVDREVDSRKPNNAKIPGGLSHTSNYASSLQTAIGLARKCP